MKAFLNKKKEFFDAHEPLFQVDTMGIMECIPNRYPFLLVDRLWVYPQAAGIGVKNVTINEPFFIGHFPSNPVMPGVLILEAMVQTACAVACRSEAIDLRHCKVYFTSVEGARFRKPVVPGDVLRFYTFRRAQCRNIWKYEAVAMVEDAVVAEAVYSAALVAPHKEENSL